jgi:hypothetical protein
MKKFLIGLLMIGSLSAFASLDMAIVNHLEEDEVFSGDDIKAAIISNLENKTFQCSYSVASIADNDTKIQVLEVLKYKETKVTVNADFSQPVITISIPSSDKDSDTDNVLFKISTSPDFKEVVEMELLRFREQKTQVNTGTIINPVFETRTERVYSIKGVCKIN